jgi:glycosyltransferase involved in cell wall biosynthesis
MTSMATISSVQSSPLPIAVARERPRFSAARPIVYGWLGSTWNKGLGRDRLMWSLSEMLPVILLDNGSAPARQDPYVEEMGENRFVLRNAMRLRNSRVGKRIATLSAWLDSAKFHRALRHAGFDDYIYWLSSNDPRMVLSMSLDRLIFDCIDPCFVKEDQEKFDRNEAAIAKKAKLVFCTAHSLHERMLAQNSRSFLVPNGCHVETYEACRSAATLLPAPLVGRKRPYIGYMGTVDWRFDAATVTEVARRMPDCTFVVVGRVNQDQETNISELRKLSNVVITGAASYDEGHAYTKAFDVGIVPFTPGPMNDAINSVKMYMYLAAGKPVVSTWLAECVRLKGFVRATQTASEFVEAIRSELAGDSVEGKARRIRFALENTWDQRAEQAIGLMQANGILP